MKIIAIEPLGLSPQEWHESEAWLLEAGHQLIVYPDRKEDKPTLMQRMKGAEVLLVSNIRLTKEILSQAPALKFINVAFTGIDHIDGDYCRAHGVAIANAAGYATTAVAELAVGLMLNLYRQIIPLDAAIRQGYDRQGFSGRQLRGKTAGIIGTGATGCATAKLLQAFGCRIVAWSRTEKQFVKEQGINYVSLRELLQQSDIISIHTPLTEYTFHLLGKEELALCRPSALIINTARGNIIDNVALANALHEKQLGGAAIDVFEQEPPLPATHPLLHAPNCIVVPHIGYATHEAFRHRMDIVLGNLRSWLALHGKAPAI
ncbi:MAG: hydroxyacid dehydrogenase [Bacteroidales bacterium]|jgi:D-3-phosphoglycerate dehydrogenase|nr:hydroxyacid dehydrogenase [Bacteroidales bacterium]